MAVGLAHAGDERLPLGSRQLQVLGLRDAGL